MSGTAEVSVDLLDDLLDAVEDVVVYPPYGADAVELRRAYDRMLGWLGGYHDV
jgi:hypothetical protein